MLPSQGHYGQLLDHSSHTRTSSPDTTPFSTDSESQSVPNPATQRSHDQDMPARDPFAYYKAFMGSGGFSDGLVNDRNLRDDGCTSAPGGKPACSSGEPLQGRPRATPNGMNVRFACRSNGAPLATIVEQRSVSTLNSRGSLRSVGRFHSVRNATNASPRRSSGAAPTGFDSEALRSISEEVHRNHDRSTSADAARVKPQQDCCESSTSLRWAMPTCTTSQEPDMPDASLTDDDEHSQSSQGLKSFLRNALHNVRGGRRAPSGASSMTNTISSQARGEWSKPTHGSPTREPCDGESENVQPKRPSVPANIPKSHLEVPKPLDGVVGGHARNRKISNLAREASAGTSPRSDSPSPSTATPYRLREPGLSHSNGGTEPAQSVRPVLAEPRAVQQEHVRVGDTTLLHLAKNDSSARCTLLSESVNHDDALSLGEYDRTRNTSRNASFCSTMSTSYSGTVLGIDLDLQHEFLHSSKRSVTPVWFSPHEHVDVALYPQTHAVGAQLSLQRSVTSSALSALLPIAAAEGIVEANPTTPQISFYSPSGNLIQAESTPPSTDTPRSDSQHPSDSTGTATLDDGSTQPTTAYDSLSASVGLPPARPTPVPMTTPPQSFAPLPEHLRHHHNYRRPDRSHIAPEPTTSPTSISAGPGVNHNSGVVPSKSEDTAPGSPIPTGRRSSHTRSISCLSPREIASSRARSPKGGKLRKHAPSHSECSVGHATSHTMRACFCQPYDAAGHQSVRERCHQGDPRPEDSSTRRARDTETPNVRIVASDDEIASTTAASARRSHHEINTAEPRRRFTHTNSGSDR